MKSIFKPALLVPLLISTFLISSCDDNNPYRTDWSLAKEHMYSLEGATKVEAADGLIYYIIEEGSGSLTVDRRDAIEVFNTGRRLENMEIFESSYVNKSTTPSFISNLGASNKPEGYKRGVSGMKVGEKRVLIVPPELGFGSSEDNPGDTLRYDVQLDEILL